MSKQRDILPQVLSFVRDHLPDSPMYLTGSVSLRHERPESDIDIFILVPDVTEVDFPQSEVEWQDDAFKLVSVPFHGLTLHPHLATPALLWMFEQHPWRAYKFLQMESLHDPDGIVKRTMDRIAPWFDDHPDAVALWQQWFAEHKARQLSQGNQLGPLLSQFPNQIPDFWNHLGEMCGDEIAEPLGDILKADQWLLVWVFPRGEYRLTHDCKFLWYVLGKIRGGPHRDRPGSIQT